MSQSSYIEKEQNVRTQSVSSTRSSCIQKEDCGVIKIQIDCADIKSMTHRATIVTGRKLAFNQRPTSTWAQTMQFIPGEGIALLTLCWPQQEMRGCICSIPNL
jgi:hypothetical protein